MAGTLIGFSKQLFEYPITGLWIAFSSAAVTFLTGLAFSLLFPTPGTAQQALVYGSGYKNPPPPSRETGTQPPDRCR